MEIQKVQHGQMSDKAC